MKKGRSRKATPEELKSLNLRVDTYEGGGFTLWCTEGHNEHWLLDGSIAGEPIELGKSSAWRFFADYEKATNSIVIKRRL